MASSSFSSSSSASNPSAKYDAFLSFRGTDTRNKFRSHLRKALREEGIKFFADDENMEIGEDVLQQLNQAIENSRCSIIIISPQYYSSKWCLNELVKILDCMKNRGQIVIPIFYQVEPCDVENLTGDFGRAFQRPEEDSVVESWRNALAEVAKLPGFELQDRDEAKFVEEIVEEVSSKLRTVSSCSPFSGLERVGLTGLISSLSTWLTRVHYIRVAFFFFNVLPIMTPPYDA